MSKESEPPDQRALPWEAAFVDAVRRLRLDCNWSQSELARRLQARGLPLHQQQIDRLEKNSRSVRLNEAVLLAQVFGRELGEMVEDLSSEDRIRQDAADAVAEYREQASRITNQARVDLATLRQAKESAHRALDQLMVFEMKSPGSSAQAEPLTHQLKQVEQQVRLYEKALSMAVDRKVGGPLDTPEESGENAR